MPVGLALSGGRFRATLFHLGVVRALRDAGILKDVSHVCSVSGGSILAAHLALHWEDYLGDRFVARAPSGHGVQLSLFGLLGFTASGVEGFELNVLGLCFGLNPFSPAIKLPLIGRLGIPR